MQQRLPQVENQQAGPMLESTSQANTMAPPELNLEASNSMDIAGPGQNDMTQDTSQVEDREEQAVQDQESGIQETEAEETLVVSGKEEDGIPIEAWDIADDPQKIQELEQQPEEEAPTQRTAKGPIQRWGFLKKIGKAIGRGVRAVGRGIKGAAKWVAKGAKKIWNGVKTGAIWAWGKAKTIGKAIARYGWNVLKSAGALAWNFITKAPGRIWEVLKHVGKGAFGVLKWLWNGIKTGVTNPKGLGKWFVDGVLSGAAWTGRLVAKLLDVVSLGEVWDLLSQIIKFNSRTLTGVEIAEAQKVFGNSISYWQVRIDEASLIAKIGALIQGSSGMGVSTAHTINFNKKISTSPGNGDMAWLIHELVHVAQYEVVGSQYIGEALYAQATAGYNYGGVAGLVGKNFSDFNREKQGDIAQDYYLGVLYNNMPGGVPSPADQPTYQPLIDQLRRGQL